VPARSRSTCALTPITTTIPTGVSAGGRLPYGWAGPAGRSPSPVPCPNPSLTWGIG